MEEKWLEKDLLASFSSFKKSLQSISGILKTSLRIIKKYNYEPDRNLKKMLVLYVWKCFHQMTLVHSFMN